MFWSHETILTWCAYWEETLQLTYRVPEKSGTNGNFNYFSYFIYKLNIIRLKMALVLDKRVEIVLLCGSQGWTQRQVADEFNARHPERNPITHSAVGKLVQKLKETGSVVDKPRVTRPSVGEDIRTGVIDRFHAHSHWFQTFRTPCTLKTRILKSESYIFVKY
jgi:hypothetical protein